MGCNCGGSGKAGVQPAQRDKRSGAPVRPEKRTAPPNDPGYYFTGPPRRDATKKPE